MAESNRLNLFYDFFRRKPLVRKFFGVNRFESDTRRKRAAVYHVHVFEIFGGIDRVVIRAGHIRRNIEVYNRVVRFEKFFEVFVKLLFVYRIGLWQRLVCISVLENLESIDLTKKKKSVAHHNAERHYAEPVFLFYLFTRVTSAVKRNRYLHFTFSCIVGFAPF